MGASENHSSCAPKTSLPQTTGKFHPLASIWPRQSAWISCSADVLSCLLCFVFLHVKSYLSFCLLSKPGSLRSYGFNETPVFVFLQINSLKPQLVYMNCNSRFVTDSDKNIKMLFSLKKKKEQFFLYSFFFFLNKHTTCFGVNSSRDTYWCLLPSQKLKFNKNIFLNLVTILPHNRQNQHQIPLGVMFWVQYRWIWQWYGTL